MNCFFIFLHSFLLQKCQLCFFLITANPLSNDSSQLSRKQITWYHQTKQCPTNQDSIAEDIYQSFVTKKCVWKSKVWRRKKHLRWQPAGSLRPYESKSCGKKSVWTSKVWRRKKHPRRQPAGSLRPYESKSCGKKVCLKKKKTKSGEEKSIQDDSLLGAWGLLFLVQPKPGGPPWRLHNDLPSTSKVRKGRQKWVIMLFYSKLRPDFNQPCGSTWLKK